MNISFTVYGIPISQPRTRAAGFVGKDGKPKAHVYEPGKKDSPARQWKSDIRWALKAELLKQDIHSLIGGPIKLWAVFYMPRTKELNKDKYPAESMPHTVRPDIENLLKLLMDSLTGIILTDDRQIYQVNVVKRYHEKTAGPRVSVTIGDENTLEIDIIPKPYL